MLTAIIFFAILYYVFRGNNSDKSDLLPYCLLGILLFGMDDD